MKRIITKSNSSQPVVETARAISGRPHRKSKPAASAHAHHQSGGVCARTKFIYRGGLFEFRGRFDLMSLIEYAGRMSFFRFHSRN